MKKYGTLKSMLAAVLSLVMLLSAVSVSFAAQIFDEEQTLQYLYTFNDAVNSIKADKPSFTYKKTAAMNKDEEIVVGSKTAADLSDDARKYLEILVDSFFNPEKGLINNFIGVLTETGSSYTEKEIYKGVDTTNLLPVKGKSYVSDLTLGDDFSLYTEKKTDILNPENDSLKIRFQFPECDLETVKDSSLKKVFDLSSGSINPVIIGSSEYDDDENDPLDKVKFDNFRYHNAYVQADFDADGKLTKYTQNISYTFSFSFYDFLRMLEVYAKTDFIEIGLAIANPILQGTGKPEVTAREILKDSMIFIQYDIAIELTDFDWTPRLFGDIDNDGDVDAYDARTALRYSVGAEQIKNQENLIYADVDFNGMVNSSDARFILRSAVDLEEKFDKVPEGETIKIVVITPPSDTPEDDAGDDTDEPSTDTDDENTSDNPALDQVTGGVSAFIDSIFTIINGFKNQGVENENIDAIIQGIKDIIEQGKADTDKDNNGGGIIVLPDTTENA